MTVQISSYGLNTKCASMGLFQVFASSNEPKVAGFEHNVSMFMSTIFKQERRYLPCPLASPMMFFFSMWK